MRDVIIALVPATVAGIYYFGLKALILIVVSIAFLLFSLNACIRKYKKTVTIRRFVCRCNRSVTGD
ncbi:MAG: RnfABCDGE type electron transport complex subunit D [Anaerotignum faecicola]